MTSSAEFLEALSPRLMYEGERWTEHELTFLNGKPVKVEVHKPLSGEQYLSLVGETDPSVELIDFFGAVESAFRQADEQRLSLGPLTVIVCPSNGDEPLMFDFERDADAASTADSLREAGFDASNMDLIRFNSQTADFCFEPGSRRAGAIFHHGENVDHPAYEFLLAMLEPAHKDVAGQLGGVVLRLANESV